MKNKNIKLVVNVILLSVIFSCTLSAQEKGNYQNFRPGKLWCDNNGKHINAHGGGILYQNGIYYWFGERKVAGRLGNTAQVGVHCYSSTDLYNWKDEGIVLSVDTTNESSEIAKGCIIERPKVIYNDKSKKYVMWFHLELKGMGYSAARCGVAVAEKVTGPYTYLGSYRPNPGKWPINATERDTTIADGGDSTLLKLSGKNRAIAGYYLRRDYPVGQMSRDMTVFKDDDGKVYLIYASEETRKIIQCT